MPYLLVPAVVDVKPANIWGLEVGKHEASSENGAWAYNPPLKTEKHFEKLVLPTFTFNEGVTRENLQKIQEFLGKLGITHWQQ